MANSLQSETARKYRVDYGMKMATLTLAKIMYAKEKKVFTNLEGARIALRYIEGKTGSAHRRHVTNSEFLIEEPRPYNPHVLPESWSEPKGIFKLPIGCNRIGFIADVQIPFQDNKAIEVFCKWLQTKKVNTIFLNGDIIDNYNISSFQRDPRKRKFKEELEATRNFLRWIRGEFPKATIYYNMDANHELRWEKWLIAKAPELLDIHEFDLSVILKLNDYNIIPLRNNKHIMIGKLPVLHGHTLFGRWGSGVSKARTVFLKTLESTIASHVHVTDEYTKKDLSGKIMTCWTTGCFMNIDAVEYNEHNDYNHGGAYIETDKDGNYFVENKRISKGKIF